MIDFDLKHWGGSRLLKRSLFWAVGIIGVCVFLLWGPYHSDAGNGGTFGNVGGSRDLISNDAGAINQIYERGIGAIERSDRVDDELNVLYKDLFKILDDPNLDPKDARKVLNRILTGAEKLIRNGDLPPEFGVVVLARFARYDAEYAWEVASDGYWGSREFPPVAAAFASIAAQLAQENVHDALGLIAKSDTPKGVVRAVFGEFLNQDRTAALDWLEGLGGSESAEVKDSLTKMAAGNFAGTGDIRDAWRMVGEIQNEAVKKQAEGVVWSTERELLRKHVADSPEETMDLIVEGDAFSDYWLEEAVHTWVSKDFDAANAWYEKNWDSLPKEKAQYVAAGFATQAIGQGDVDTARQWAAMIQDAKTKARIEANIAKAVANQK
jgi:hypothetical protein